MCDKRVERKEKKIKTVTFNIAFLLGRGWFLKSRWQYASLEIVSSRTKEYFFISAVSEGTDFFSF